MPYLILKDGERIGISDDSPIGPLPWFAANCPAYSMDHATAHEGYSVETVESVDCHDVESLLAAICARAGITMATEFVPFSLSRHAAPDKDGKVWRSLNWRVTLSRHGREFLTTNYSQGVGHAPAAKMNLAHLKPASWREKLRHEAEDIEIESGRVSSVPGDHRAPHPTGKRIPAPSIGDVVQSLAMDSDVLDYGGFESWAAEFGYDADSRSAEAAYRACVEIATKLRAALGESLLAEIRLAASFN